MEGKLLYISFLITNYSSITGIRIHITLQVHTIFWIFHGLFDLYFFFSGPSSPEKIQIRCNSNWGVSRHSNCKSDWLKYYFKKTILLCIFSTLILNPYSLGLSIFLPLFLVPLHSYLFITTFSFFSILL